MRITSRLAAAGVGLLATAAIAACGSGEPGGTTASAGGSARYGAAVQFAKCVRSHGVPDFPDPSRSGGVQFGSGINRQSPAFKSAQRACQKLLKVDGPSQQRIAQVRTQMLQFAQCMRGQGISGFPDPTLSASTNSNPGSGNAVSFDGVYLPIPNTMNTQAPAFKHAATICEHTVADLHLGL